MRLATLQLKPFPLKPLHVALFVASVLYLIAATAGGR
jgi:hypothetical protein